MRAFPWVDFFIFGGLFLFALFCGFLVTLSGPHTVLELCITWGIVLVFLGISVMIVLRKYMAHPDFITIQGTYIWANGIDEIDVYDMNAALSYYVTNLPKLTALVTQKEIENMLFGACIEWRQGPITLMGLGWLVKDKEGLQKGKSIIVHYPDKQEFTVQANIERSALYHEIHHMVDEVVLKREIDYMHKNTEWWNLLMKMGVSS
jgi:hypothetical protein